ncbi:uncharacterized protein [Euphorbia lathyris]|uniref:uncharacterized protein isoform X2 n=1 Tax=Euphorbia lathyris TaxID=212925 RepID=UPI0033144D14
MVPTGNEDTGEVNVTDCTELCYNGQVETRCEDAVESTSSFGDSLSDNKNALLFGEMEVESPLGLGFDDASHLGFDDCGSEFHMRRTRPTDHWRRFIRPLMWRCKWLELQMRNIRSQYLKYDRELAEHAQRKMFDFHTYLLQGFDGKSLQFDSFNQRKKAMQRKKRKRIEEMTNIMPYMLQHNVFSYYENRKTAVNFGSLNDDCSNLAKAINATDEFGLEDEWQPFESKGDDNIREDFLRKVEVLQSQVRKLKARIEKVVNENPGKFQFQVSGENFFWR